MTIRPILHFAPNTCARVTLTALEEIGEPFETRLIAFMAGEHRKPEFLAINPAGKVPALETAHGVIVQNGAILSYLAQVHPDAGLLPQPEDAAGRAEILAELFRCSSDLHPLVTRFVMAPMISIEAGDAPRIRSKAAEGLALQLAPVERRLEAQPWMLGQDWSILDAYLAWIWFRHYRRRLRPARIPCAEPASCGGIPTPQCTGCARTRRRGAGRTQGAGAVFPAAADCTARLTESSRP